MASAQNRKRARADDLSQERRPTKRIKSSGRLREPSNFAPEFWDNLSKVPLTRRALRELDRRNRARPAPGPAAPAVYTADRARFARHGGPDLRHLRGCPEPKGAVHTMASCGSSAPSSRQTKSTKSTKATTATPKKSSAYDKAFEQHLHDNNVYLHGRKSKPKNNADLHQPRPSLSPSKFSDGAFERFQDEHDHLGSEGDVMRKIIPVIAGNANTPNSGEALFNNLQSITDGETVDAKPDFYDGVRFGDVDKQVRKELDHLIIPTKHTRRPVAPNFFLEAKDPEGGAGVAKRQAGLDGAIGARAMQALQNYGAEEPAFDGNAYTYSSTYHAGTGTLQLYAHHVTPPTAPGGRPEYHMTQVKAFAMTSDLDTFVQGATAFRNARDLAQGHRDGFIQAANARARQSNVVSPPEAETTVAVAEQYEASADEFVDCEDYPGSEAIGTEDDAASGDVDEEPALPQYLCAEDEEPSEESTSLGAEPAMSFATSFMSSFSQSQTSSKRTRASHSPPSNSQPRKKHDRAKGRARRSTPRRAAGSSAQGSASSGFAVPQPASAEGYWTWSDEHQKWYHLNEDGSCIWDDGE